MSRSVQWLNENSYRLYPFVEDSVLTAGTATLPLAALLDMSITNYNSDACDVRLLTFEITSAVVPECIFTFEYVGGSQFTVTVPSSAALPYTTTVSSAAVHRVTCVFGTGMNDLFDLTAATYTLDTPPVIEPALASFHSGTRVDSIIGTAVGSTAVTGIVYMMEGYNCVIGTSLSDNSITISAVRGGGAGMNCDTLAPVAPYTCYTALMSINGFHGDDNGNIDLIGGDGVTIIPSGNGLIRVVGAKQNTDVECG